MKALVLCGGIPQAALIEELKSRDIYTVLVDRNEHVMARLYADKFYPVSVLDVNAVKKVAQNERVDFIITVCADQVLLVQAQVSEMLGLPCYISYKTARDVSSKELMKKVFVKNKIPTSKYVVMGVFCKQKVQELKYPLIVKPVDSYSSRGVKKVLDERELLSAFNNAIKISRTNTAIVEEYVEGDELTVDVYVEDGKVHILCISNIDKVPCKDCFVISRTRYPARITYDIRAQIKDVAQKIAKAFDLKNSPMLIQMITDGEKVSVVECCARTGGGDKFRLIKQVSNFDVIKAAVDLTLGKKPHVEPYQFSESIVNEFLYVDTCIFDHLYNFEKLKKQGILKEYFLLKAQGTVCGEVRSSGDRVAYYTIQAKNMEEAWKLDKQANEQIKIIDSEGKDRLRHDLVADY